MLDSVELKDLHTFHDAVDRLHTLGAISVSQYMELTGFGILPGNRKQELVGNPFLIIQYEFRVGKGDGTFVECYIVTTNDKRYILRDSSRGINAQLKVAHSIREKAGHPAPHCGIFVHRGLTFKDSPYRDESGHETMSRTYYLT